MVLELTKKCNLDCFYCECKNSNMENLSQEAVLEMVKDAAANGDTTFELSGGEPLLYPEIEELVKKMKDIEGVEKVILSTNGILLPDKFDTLKAAGLDEVYVHMDTTDAWDYADITSKEMVLNHVLSGIWMACAKDMPITVQTVMHEKSKDALVVIAGFAKKLDINIRFLSMKGYSEEAGLTEEKVAKKLSRHFKEFKQQENHVYVSPDLKGKIMFGIR